MGFPQFASMAATIDSQARSYWSARPGALRRMWPQTSQVDQTVCVVPESSSVGPAHNPDGVVHCNQRNQRIEHALFFVSLGFYLEGRGSLVSRLMMGIIGLISWLVGAINHLLIPLDPPYPSYPKP